MKISDIFKLPVVANAETAGLEKVALEEQYHN
jgi:hypothetical protein